MLPIFARSERRKAPVHTRLIRSGRAMKFGLFGGARARGGPAGDSDGYHSFINYIIEAERFGFSSVFLVEHHFTGFGQVSASLNLLSYLAARTERIRLGTAVVVLPWHNPVLVAEEAATLDLLSNGRLDFGVGKGYRPLLDPIAPIDVIIGRVRIFREACVRVGRPYDPMMVGVTRGLQIVHNEEERKRAIVTRREVLKNIGDLARGPGAERYHHIKDDADAFELDDAPLLGTPEEIIARLKRLEAGGVQNVLFAAPGASVAGLRTFAEEIMPAFAGDPMRLAQV